jgi:subtilisin family serine protease
MPHLALALALALVAPTSRPATPAPDVIVCFRHAPTPPRLPARLAAAGFTLATALEDGLPPAHPAPTTERRAPALGPDPFGTDFASVRLVRAPTGLDPEEAASMLRAEPAVAWAEPNRLYELAAFGEPGSRGHPAGSLVAPQPRGAAAPESARLFHPDDPFYRDGRQWGLRNAATPGADVRAAAAWAVTTGSPDLWLAVADTGVDPAHPDLERTLPDGAPRFAWGANVTAEASGSWADSVGHGTMVMGVMSALTNNGALWDSLGMAGMCGGDGRGNPGCRLIPLKIAAGHARVAATWDIARAILHAVRLGARAVNLSFAGAAPSTLIRQALLHAVTRGCVVVCAAGNQGDTAPGRLEYPAAYAADGLCVSVGASGPDDCRAPWSCFGPGLDLVAPGLDIWSTWPTYPNAYGAIYDGYARWAGTSFAAPHVTGVVGLLSALRPELCDNDCQELLRRGATDLAEPGPDATTGWGRLDAASALALIAPPIAIWHDEAAPQGWRAAGVDTLRVGEAGPGALTDWRGARLAERVEATARVAWPDSFVELPIVWPRVGGTFTLRGDFRVPYFAPWAEVVPGSVDAEGFTLRGYLYRALPGAACDTCAREDYAPLPPEQARFGFTAVGRVRRPASAWRAPEATRLSVFPNPFRSATRVRGPAGGQVEIFDPAGRLVRRIRLGGAGELVWDGTGAAGGSVPPGLYLARLRGDGGPARRLVRLR